ncbi:MAG: L-threonine 3-dehydrogenase [Chloroflexi bacterium]|nr:L-threonine 3-dehydrogenase [Chloroflexota bacterium]
MRAIVKPAAAPGLELVERPVPQPGPGEVLLHVLAMGICGTDLHIHDWDPWAAARVRPPLVLGHEFVGDVVATGPGVNHPAVGDRVVPECHLPCRRCVTCLVGQPHLCEQTRIVGVDRDGGFADYAVVPAEHCWPIGAEQPIDVAAIRDPLGNAVHMVTACGVSARTVLVVGCGPIGLMAIAVARACGAGLVLATDPSAYRRALAVRMGATEVLDPAAADVVAAVRARTGVGVDVVLEASGHPAAIRDGFRALRAGGDIALLGTPTRPVELDLAKDVIFKGATVRGITGRRMFETWVQMANLLDASALDVRPLITHRLPMPEFAAGIELLRSGQAGKVVLLT